MYWLGHGIIMSIAFFTCTIPSLVLFFVLSKYRGVEDIIQPQQPEALLGLDGDTGLALLFQRRDRPLPGRGYCWWSTCWLCTGWVTASS